MTTTLQFATDTHGFAGVVPTPEGDRQRGLRHRPKAKLGISIGFQRFRNACRRSVVGVRDVLFSGVNAACGFQDAQ